jgi:hypothetical protein
LVTPLSLLNDELDLLALWLFEKLLVELSCRLEEENMLTVVAVISSESRFVLKTMGSLLRFILVGLITWWMAEQAEAEDEDEATTTKE